MVVWQIALLHQQQTFHCCRCYKIFSTVQISSYGKLSIIRSHFRKLTVLFLQSTHESSHVDRWLRRVIWMSFCVWSLIYALHKSLQYCMLQLAILDNDTAYLFEILENVPTLLFLCLDREYTINILRYIRLNQPSMASDLLQHCFSIGLTPIRYLNRWWFIVDWTSRNKLDTKCIDFYSTKWIWKCRRRNGGHFFRPHVFL